MPCSWPGKKMSHCSCQRRASNGGLQRSSLVASGGRMAYASSMALAPRILPATSWPHGSSFASPAPSLKPSVVRQEQR